MAASRLGRHLWFSAALAAKYFRTAMQHTRSTLTRAEEWFSPESAQQHRGQKDLVFLYTFTQERCKAWVLFSKDQRGHVQHLACEVEATNLGFATGHSMRAYMLCIYHSRMLMLSHQWWFHKTHVLYTGKQSSSKTHLTNIQCPLPSGATWTADDKMLLPNWYEMK